MDTFSIIVLGIIFWFAFAGYAWRKAANDNPEAASALLKYFSKLLK